jgi:hypothetical protein
MKRTILAAAVAASLVAAFGASAQATEVGYSRKFGLGGQLGDPTGLTAKLWIGPTNALDFGLGFYAYGVVDRCYVQNGVQICNRGGYSDGTFNMDYLWQSNIVRRSAQLDWHLGVGGRMTWIGNCSGDCIRVSARAPVGLDLMFQNPSFLELYFEIAFDLNVFPGVWLDPEGGIGARFYF